MKQSTSFAQVANSIKNLLQGYTKGIRFTAILILLLMGVSNAWAYDVAKNAVIYMDNSAANWTYSNIYFVINSNGYPMSAVANTQLYVHKRTDNTWGGYSSVRFFAATSSWGGNNASLGSESNMSSYGANLTNTITDYGFGAEYYVIKLDKAGTKTSSSTRANLSASWIGKAYTDLNKTITIQAKVSTNGGSTYSDANTPAKLTGSSKIFTAYNSCAGTSGASATLNAGSFSTTFKAGYTANTTLTAVAATGYTFAGWCSGSTKISDDLSITVNPTGDVTYYAYYKANSYTVKFDANRGTGTMSNQSYAYGVSKALTANEFRRTGYTFAGWNTNADGTGTSYTDEQSVSNLTSTDGGSVTLYAQWTANTYAITYKDQGNVEFSGKHADGYPAQHTYGTKTTLKEPTKNGYTFDGWFISSDCSGTAVTSLGAEDYTDVITLYAKWTENATYSLLVEIGDGIESVTGSEDPVSLGSSYSITATLKPGYAFSVWTADPVANATFADATSSSTDVTVINGSVTVTANAEEIKHAVQVNIKTGQDAWGELSTNSVEVGQITKSSTITASPKTSLGYEFDHWEISDGITIVDGTENSTEITIKATKAGSITAHFRGVNRLQNVFLIGPMNDWKESDADWQFYKLPGEEGNTVTLTKTINKADYHNDGYKFGINIYHSDWGDKYWKNRSDNDTKMDAHNCTGWVFGTKDGEKLTYIDFNVSGEYTFTLDHSGTHDQQALSITYPDKSFIEGAFEHAWDEEAYPLVENGNIQEVTIHIASKNDVEFRLVSHGKLWGTSEKNLIASNTQTLSAKNMEDDGAVMKIGAYLEGDYTFSFDKSTQVLTVTYPVVNQLQVYRSNPEHAEAINNWNWDNQDGNVYTKALSLNANTTYEFKTVVNSDFFGQNTTLTRQSSSTTLSTSGGDVQITTDVAGNYIFTYNSESKQLSITYPEAYTVTYGVGDNKGAESVTTNLGDVNGKLVLAGTSITFSKSATKDGYTWKGWYSQVDGNGTLLSAADQDYISPALAANLNVYACYDLIPYNIEYNLNDGAGAENTTYNVTTPTITLPTPARTGYTFVGWYTESDLSGEAVQTIPQGSTGDKTFYAKWTPTEYTITYQSNGGTGAENTTYTIESEDIILPTEMLRTGYTFVGWYAKSDFSGDVVTILETGSYGNKTFYAKWNPITYTITYKDQGAVDFSGSNTASLPTKHTYGAQTILVAGEREGYIFRGWYIDQECGGTALTQLAATAYADHITLYAKWECTPPTSVAISGTYHFFPGETITLTATPEGGSPDCTYQWQKFEGSNWKDIDGATSHVYTKAEASVADAGKYRCVVTAGGSCEKESPEYAVKCLQLYLYMSNNSDKENLPLSKVDGSKATATVNLENSDYTYHFKVTDGCGNWYGNSGTMTAENRTNWPMDCDAYCGLYSNRKGQYKFTIDYTDLAQLKVSVVYPSANQVADKVIYWDNSVLNWANVYYRIGHTNHTKAVEMQKVPGTTNLYQVTTSAYDGFEVWHIANNAGWTGEGNTIYKTKTNDAYTITDAMAFEPNVVTEDQTVVPTNNPATGNTEQNNNCQFYPYERAAGVKSHTATINAATNGTIQVAYTDVNGNAQTFTEGTQNLAHTCLLTITAEPKTGYSLQSLTVNGEAFTSGNTYTLTSDATIEAAWVPVTYTITYENLDGATANNPDAYTIESNITLNEPTNAPEGYTFVGWYENADYTGNKVTNINGATGDKTLYAKWAYTVQWSVNGQIVETQTVEYGSNASAPYIAPPYPCGAVLAGWTDAENGVYVHYTSTLYEGAQPSIEITENTTFYAVFADYED